MDQKQEVKSSVNFNPINFDYKNDKYVKWTIFSFNIIFLLTIIAGLIIDIWLWNQMPFQSSKSVKSIGKTMGTVGMILSFGPLLGLVLKFVLSIFKKNNLTNKNPYFYYTSLVLNIILFWERKTRLAMAWGAIFLLVAHLSVFASLTEAGIWGNHKWTWDTPSYLGIASLAILIVMNLNGIIILILKTKKVFLSKIKYIGMFNLVMGISFLVITILHVVMMD